MADKPPEEDDKAAEAEFQRVLGNLAKMPPKPHSKRAGKEPPPERAQD